MKSITSLLSLMGVSVLGSELMKCAVFYDRPPLRMLSTVMLVFHFFSLLRGIPFLYCVCLVISEWTFGLLLRTVTVKFLCGGELLSVLDV